ncbi:MTL26 protein, partial [Indicator maculatus]|nr:MTL26 protein [Indicator maculatus]
MQVPAAAERNKGPILKVLRQSSPGCATSTTLLLDTGDSTGGHAAGVCLGSACSVGWQRAGSVPSRADVGFGAHSISAYVEALRIPNLLPPILLDVAQGWETWGGAQSGTLDLLVSINMMHITELGCTEGLFKGAGVLLKPGGVLFTYG